MIAKFETSIIGKQGNRKLVLKDVSDYQTSTPTNRYWIITKADGNIEEFLTQGTPVTGQTFDYPIDKDYALIVNLAFDYSPSSGLSLFNKQCNVLCSSDICELVYDLRKFFQDNFTKSDDFGDTQKDLLEQIELINSFKESAVRLLSTDIVGSQKSLDFGIGLGIDYKHCNNIPEGIPSIVVTED